MARRDDLTFADFDGVPPEDAHKWASLHIDEHGDMYVVRALKDVKTPLLTLVMDRDGNFVRGPSA